MAVLAGVLLILGTCRTVGYKVSASNEDFRITGNKLTAYLGTDTFVSIPDSVTVIGEGAFAGNETITKVEFPSKLKTIEYNAFGQCTALSDVIIPDSVTKISPGAFKGCSSLSMVEIGKNVKSWGSGVFNDCTSLANIIVDKDNRYLTYYNGALYNGDMSMLYQVLSGRTGENYVMPETVETIDAYAFWNLQNVKNVMISDSVKTIPRASMSNMGSVENVVLTDNVKEISGKAVINNENLAQIYIPEKVKKINENAFSNNSKLKILTSKESTADKYGKEYKIPVIFAPEYPTDFNDSKTTSQDKPSTTVKVEVEKEPAVNKEPDTSKEEEIDNSDEENTSDDIQNEQLTEHPLSETVIVAGKAVVLMDRSNARVYGTPAKEEEASAQSNTESESEETKNTVSVETKTEGVSKESASEEQSDTIPERKYYKNTELTEYAIDRNIKKIGRLAFARSGIEEIVIPDSVTTIDYGAFYACDKLENVSIPSTVTSLGNKAFADTPWLKNWIADSDSEDKFLIVGDGILIAYRGNSSHVEIPDTVKEISSEVFKGHTELEKVTIPESVAKIGGSAFAGCSSLGSVEGCKGIKQITSGSFRGTKVSEENIKTKKQT